jgi:hypothetical protein
MSSRTRYQIPSLAEAEVPAAQRSVGVVIVVWEPVPRRELEYPGDVGVAGEGVIWECEDLVLGFGVDDDPVHLPT